VLFNSQAGKWRPPPCAKFRRSFMPGVTGAQNAPFTSCVDQVSIRQLVGVPFAGLPVRALAKMPRVCFADLVVGAGPHSISRFDSAATVELERWRDFMLDNMRAAQPVLRQHQLLLARKLEGGKGRHFINHDELLRALRGRFEPLGVRVVDFHPEVGCCVTLFCSLFASLRV
jgi:hypothetical protein